MLVAQHKIWLYWESSLPAGKFELSLTRFLSLKIQRCLESNYIHTGGQTVSYLYNQSVITMAPMNFFFSLNRSGLTTGRVTL